MGENFTTRLIALRRIGTMTSAGSTRPLWIHDSVREIGDSVTRLERRPPLLGS